LRQQVFHPGDVLLLQGDAETVDDAIANLGLLPLGDRDLQLVQPRRVKIALAVFVTAVAASVAGLPVAIAFIIAIGAYVVLDILPMRELYRDIDWPVIVLLGAMLPVGTALDRTGATTLIASAVVDSTTHLSPALVLTLVMVLTIAMSSVVNNAATALVMAPIAAGIAVRLGVAVDPFLMAVAIGSSCAFLTPIGHQSNTLVMGPGGYAFGDYWRVGLPLEAIIVATGIPLILLVWPL
jgi:di/tricarboxylate transporter